MPKTYESIATTALLSDQTNIDFTSINQTYTDLLLVIYAANTGTNNERAIQIQVGNNSFDTSTNYSSTFLRGELTVLDSTRVSNMSWFYGGITNSGINTARVHRINFMNYSNTTVNKTILSIGAKDGGRHDAIASLWRSNSAINQIRISCSVNQWASGSTFSLYGIKAF